MSTPSVSRVKASAETQINPRIEYYTETSPENKFQRLFDDPSMDRQTDQMFAHLKNRAFDQAKQIYDQLSNSPERSERLRARFNFALGLRVHLNRYTEALSYINLALEIIGNVKFDNTLAANQFKACCYLEKGRNHRFLNQMDKARDAFSKSLKYYPNALTYNSYGILFQDLKNYKQAKIHYKRAIALEPKLDSGHINYGTLNLNEYYATLNIDYLYLALQCYTDAEKCNDRNPLIYQNRGEVWQQLGDFDKSNKDLQKSLELSPHTTAYTLIGRNFVFQKNLAEARRNYNQALNLNPEDIRANSDLAVVEFLEMKYEAATELLQKVLEKTPTSKGTLLNLSAVAIAQKNYIEALDYIEKILIVAEKDPLTNEQTASIYFQIGLILSIMGFFEEAHQACQVVLSLTKSIDTIFYTHRMSGNNFLDQREYSKALAELNQAKSFISTPEIDALIREAQNLHQNPPPVISNTFMPSRVRNLDSPLLLNNIACKSKDASESNPGYVENGKIFFPSLMGEELRKPKVYYLLRMRDDVWYEKKSEYNSPEKIASNLISDFVILPTDTDNIEIRMGTQGHYHLAHARDVLFAGEISIKKGKVIFWTNCSGHYKPFDNAQEISERAKLPKDKFFPRYAIKSRVSAILEQLQLKSPHSNLPLFTNALSELTKGEKSVAKSVAKF